MADVLVVEDAVSLRMLLEAFLYPLGLSTVAVSNSEQALQQIEGGCQPKLLIADVLMPGETGLTLAIQLQKRLPDLRILLMSAYSNYPGLPEFLASPRASFLEKPFSEEQLRAEVTYLLGLPPEQ